MIWSIRHGHWNFSLHFIILFYSCIITIYVEKETNVTLRNLMDLCWHLYLMYQPLIHFSPIYKVNHLLSVNESLNDRIKLLENQVSGPGRWSCSHFDWLVTERFQLTLIKQWKILSESISLDIFSLFLFFCLSVCPVCLSSFLSDYL